MVFITVVCLEKKREMVVLDQNAQKSIADTDFIPLSVYYKGIWELWERQTYLSLELYLSSVFQRSQVLQSHPSSFVFSSLCCLKYNKEQLLTGDLMGRRLYYTHLSLFPLGSFGFQ